jgi:LacI family transcriptional regulator
MVGAMTIDPGARVTLRMLADQLGLSVTTISRALKDGPEVNAETIALVKAAASAAGYRPNLGGVNLRTGKSGAIGVVLPFERQGELNIVVASLVEGVVRHMKANGYRTILVPQLETDDPQQVVRDLVGEGAVDGIILTHTRPDDARVRYLLDWHMPVATFGRTELPTPHASLDLDHAAIGTRAALLLIEAGHTSPLLVAPSSQFTYSRHFVAGWRRGFAECGLATPEDRIHHAATTPDSGRSLAQALLARHPDARAAFVASEEAALGFVAGLALADRFVGRDFALVTYGGTDLHDFLVPPVSAFHFPNIEIGGRLAELLMQAMAGVAPDDLYATLDARFADHGSQHLRP